MEKKEILNTVRRVSIAKGVRTNCLDFPTREVVPHDECRDQQRFRVGASVASIGETCAF